MTNHPAAGLEFENVVTNEAIKEALDWIDFFLYKQNTVVVDNRAKSALATIRYALTQPVGKYIERMIEKGIEERTLEQQQPDVNAGLGTAVQAIEFAITIDDHYDRLEFLESWKHGDLSEWDDFKSFIRAEQKGGQS